MFTPKYTITDRLLAQIKRINEIVLSLNNRRFSEVVLMELERTARAVSAHASTSIEGNPLPLTEVKKILKSQPAHLRDSEREVLNYNVALQDLNTQIDTTNPAVSLQQIVNIQKQVVRGLLPSFHTGKLRQGPVVVNDPRTGQAVYLPPDHKDMTQRMEELVTFVNKQKNRIDPLIVAGIFHKQMVIIHPFMDGNGRTARLVTKKLLAAMGLNTFHLFSFENYYNKNVTKYFQIVGEYGNYYDISEKIDFTQWLEYFTEGIIDELLRVQELLPQSGVTPQLTLQPYHEKILELIREKNFTSDPEYAKYTKRAKATRALDFKKLIALGFIERKGKGKATYYILKEN